MFLIRGDYQINEVKLSNEFPGKKIVMTSPEEVYQLTGAPIGFIGPIGLKEISIFADTSLEGMQGAVCGANEKDMHFTGVTFGKDFNIEREMEIYEAKEGGDCVCCGAHLSLLKGIEVGHIFKLGKKYTSAFDIQILDENGKKKVPTMGCYGIGLTRMIASIIEQQHDGNGIVWPMSVSPFYVHMVTLDAKDSEMMNYAEKIYTSLMEKKVETLWDDRNERAGFKFKDADLLGIPLQVVIGSKNFSNGNVEIKERANGKKKTCEAKNLIHEIESMIASFNHEIRNHK